MRSPASSCLYFPLDLRHVDVTVVTDWEAAGLRLVVEDEDAPVRWGSRLTAVRRRGRWSRGRAGGACTLDLVPAGAGRTMAVLTLEQPPRRLSAPVAAEDCWSALSTLRDVLEAEGVDRPAAERVRGEQLAPVERSAELPTPPSVASGILPA